MATYTLFLIRPEDDDSVPDGMVDVHDSFGNSYGPFATASKAVAFAAEEIEGQKLIGNEVSFP
jgi:hypothetical protein